VKWASGACMGRDLDQPEVQSAINSTTFWGTAVAWTLPWSSSNRSYRRFERACLQFRSACCEQSKGPSVSRTCAIERKRAFFFVVSSFFFVAPQGVVRSFSAPCVFVSRA
jgi:hypothetical protein